MKPIHSSSQIFPIKSRLIKSHASFLCLWLFFIIITIKNAIAFNVNPIFFDEGLSHLFGDSNLIRSPDDRSVRLLLDKYTGSGFISTGMYQHGFFSAMIKLPGDYTAGVVVAFYMSNGDVFVKNHDELDFEFLGNTEGKPWRFQTNLYGNGSINRGREERYRLWFDPSREFHRYSILWNPNKIIFWVDEVPVREVIKNEEMGSDYPQKPMSLYATIWDASSWATSGGRFAVDYRFSPFISEFKDIVLDGCHVSTPTDGNHDYNCSTNSESSEEYNNINIPVQDKDYSIITSKQRAAMRRFRERFMYYSYCYDSVRYAIPPPECVPVSSEKQRFKDTGRLRFGGSRPKPRKVRRGRHRFRPSVTV